MVVWRIASGLFAFYVANFVNYNKAYGSIAGVIIFLVWLWISNMAILFGAEFNAELERGRAAAGGDVPLGHEPYVEPRDMRKIRKKKEHAKHWHVNAQNARSSCAQGAHPWQAMPMPRWGGGP